MPFGLLDPYTPISHYVVCNIIWWNALVWSEKMLEDEWYNGLANKVLLTGPVKSGGISKANSSLLCRDLFTVIERNVVFFVFLDCPTPEFNLCNKEWIDTAKCSI